MTNHNIELSLMIAAQIAAVIVFLKILSKAWRLNGKRIGVPAC